MNVTKPRWSPQTKLTISILMLGLGIYLLYRFAEVIPPMILAIILAYILSPIVNFLWRKLHIHRVLATIITYLLFLVVIVAVPWLLIPLLVEQFSGLNLDFQLILGQAVDLFGRDFVVGEVIILDGEALFERMTNVFQELLSPAVEQSFGFAVEVISSFVWVIFILVISFYLIKDTEALRKWFDRLPPPAYREDFQKLRQKINQIWGAFFRGQLTLAFVVSIILTVVGLILGLPFALALGIIGGLLEFLPTIGHILWFITVSILSLSFGSTWIPIPNWIFMLVVMGVTIIFQQFDLNYLIPRIIGRRVHLPPLVVILGIVAGAALAGVLGVILAAPTIASARVIFGYIYANILDMDPFEEEIETELPPPDPRWWDPRKTRSDDIGTREAEPDDKPAG